MMNLKKMKNSEKKKNLNVAVLKKSEAKKLPDWRKAIVWIPLVFALVLQPVNAFAADTDTVISIEKPSGWKQGNTTVKISVDGKGFGENVSISKIEAKVGEGNWEDITGSKSVTIAGNGIVYVKVTDSEGNTYEQNRSIRCYDSEKPTLAASLSDGVLTIQGNDTVSGIQVITVNGTSYDNLADGTLKVQLTQKDFTTKVIEMSATDYAGNVSDKYTIQNPYYEWAKKQAEAQKKEESEADYTTSTPITEAGSADSSGTPSPLPQDGGATEPTESKGSVIDRTETGASKVEETTGEPVDTVTQTGTEGSKVFYTITTKSGKIFYLIVDNSKQGDNVYFLTEVSERDLMNFTLSDTVRLPDVDTVYAEKETEKAVETEAPETEVETETEEVKMPEARNSFVSYILIAVIAVALFGGAYYFKIYKKQDPEDDEEFEEEYEPEYENDDEGAEPEENYLDDELEEEEE